MIISRLSPHHVVAEALEFNEFVTRLRQRFKASSDEYVVKVNRFLLGPKEIVASLFPRFNHGANIVEKDHGVTSEAPTLKFLSILPSHIGPWVKMWHTDTDLDRFSCSYLSSSYSRGH